MICVNRSDPPNFEEPPKSCGLFIGLSEGLQKCEFPDPEIIMLIHKWVMNGIEKLIYSLELDPIEAMAGDTPLRLHSNSGGDWIRIDLIFRKKIMERLELSFEIKQ